ncbi:MAG: uroporphyrinogen-III C-methyltransferase [Pseudomonadales bacterium]|nr:uroporphyrinogen-III C-methyltransferase [Pseudomonadales bacterium]
MSDEQSNKPQQPQEKPGNAPGTPAAKNTDTPPQQNKTTAKASSKPPSKPSQKPDSTPTPDKPSAASKPPVTNKQNKAKPQKAAPAKSSAKTSTTGAPAKATKTNKTPLIIGIVALVIALAVAVGAGYNWDQQQKTSAAHQNQITELNRRLQTQQLSLASLGNVQTTVGQVVTDLNSELAKLGSQIGQLGADVGQLGAQSGRVDQLEINLDQFTSKLETTLEQIAGRVNEISTSSRTDWQIAEVEYFLRLATDSLIIEGNTKTAQALLEAADRLVQEIDDVGLISLRQAIADDLVAIKGIRVPDYQGMAFTLNALAKQVDNLRMPLQSKPTKSAQASINNTPEQSAPIETTWLQRIQIKLVKLGQQLSGLVSIRRTDQPVEPLMPPEQQTYLQQNLHLMLEQAQLALLRKNQALFQQSLDKALGWIQTYYDPKDAASISFVKNLTELKNNDISLELPDISGSLRTFKQFQKQRLELDTQAAQAQRARLEVNLR